MRTVHLVLMLGLLLTLLSCPGAPPPTPPPEVDLTHLHDPFDQLLQRYVKGGLVDYRAWQKNPADVQALDDYLTSLAELRPDNFASYGERKAFWINAYNALTIKRVLDVYPIKSVEYDQQKNPDERVKDFFTSRERKLGAVMVTLAELERERADTRNNPLLHFALVQPARSAPDLQPFAYRGAQFNHQISTVTTAFLANEQKGLRVDPPNRTIYVSNIFKQHRLEFQEELLTFLKKYAPPTKQEQLNQFAGPAPTFEYLPFDWSLNDASAPAKPGDQPAQPKKSGAN